MRKSSGSLRERLKLDGRAIVGAVRNWEEPEAGQMIVGPNHNRSNHTLPGIIHLGLVSKSIAWKVSPVIEGAGQIWRQLLEWRVIVLIISIAVHPLIVVVVMFGIHGFVRVLCATDRWSCLERSRLQGN